MPYIDKKVKSMPIIAIVGPTASGKTSLAVSIARVLKGEIISADSRQVYRGMDIGTGKVTKREMRGIPHYLLDVANPKRIFTVAGYIPRAERAVRDIWKRGKTPIICGGTGFYIDALLRGESIPDVPPNLKLRKQLKGKPARELYLMLKKLDPRRAKTIDAKNPVRLIRAIEIAQVLGKVPKQTSHPLTNRILWIGIARKPDELKQFILKRLHARIKIGMLKEMKRLHEEGVSWKRMEAMGLEYRFSSRYLTGKITKQEFVGQLSHAIEQFAKRQMTWFKRNREIHWVKNEREAFALVKKFQNS